jgi:hypothetical protein
MFIPLRIRDRIASTDSVAGPRVQTMWALRMVFIGSSLFQYIPQYSRRPEKREGNLRAKGYVLQLKRRVAKAAEGEKKT